MALTQMALTRGEDLSCNRAKVRAFFDLFGRDWDGFRGLWVEHPSIRIPFAPPGMPKEFEGGEGYDAFWKPIFATKGRFDWTIVNEIVGVNSDEIVTQTLSDFDFTAGGRRIAYNGEYIQVFAFSDGRIQSFIEYVDSYAMGKIYRYI